MNKWLKGNGHWCPACGGTGRGRAADRVVYDNGKYAQFYDACTHCNGERRIAGPGPNVPEPTCGFLNQCLEYGTLTTRRGR